MQFFAVATALFAAVAVASPVDMVLPVLEQRAAYEPCNSTSLYSKPLCCAVSVLGVVSLDCATPPHTPQSEAEFSSICLTTAQKPQCCLLSVLSEAVLCESPGAFRIG